MPINEHRLPWITFDEAEAAIPAQRVRDIYPQFFEPVVIQVPPDDNPNYTIDLETSNPRPRRRWQSFDYGRIEANIMGSWSSPDPSIPNPFGNPSASLGETMFDVVVTKANANELHRVSDFGRGTLAVVEGDDTYTGALKGHTILFLGSNSFISLTNLALGVISTRNFYTVLCRHLMQSDAVTLISKG